MSADDFKPATPETPSQARDDDARRLEAILESIAKGLGMKVRVTAGVWHFRIHARLQAPSEVCNLDEEIYLVKQPPGSTAFVDLILREMEGLQMTLHNNMAVAMSKTDVRGRQFGLSKEDKRLLHDMLMDATAHQMRDYSRAEQGHKKVLEYEALLGRLFR